ncbi:MAG: hypothetical protein Q7U47_04050 [Paludibacter sp.]|nr:hypothetical protein [Paludibacter sp.]
MSFKKINILLIFLPLVFLSCEHEMNLDNITDEFSDNISLIIPLGSFDASVGSSITNYLKHNAKIAIVGDEVHYIVADSSVIDFHELNLLKNAQTLNNEITPPTVVLQPNTFQLFPFQQNIDLGLNSDISYERVDSVKIKRSVISFTLVELYQINPENIEVTLTFPASKVKDIKTPIVFKPTVTGIPLKIELKDIRFCPEGSNNPLPVTVNFKLKAGTQPLTITPQTKIGYTIKFETLEYTIAYGFFAPSAHARQILRRKLNMDSFLANSFLRFTNPKFDVTGTSNVGAYLKFNFDLLKVYYDDNSAITADFGGKKWMEYSFMAKPSVPGEIIPFKMKTIDNLWGGTNRFFDKLEKPDSLEYVYGAEIDTYTKTSDTSPDFLIPDSKLKVKVTATLPFQLNSGSFFLLNDSVTGISESLAAQIEKIDFGNIDSTFLILKIENGLPFGCIIDLSFLDSDYSEITTGLNKSYIIQSAEVNSDGKVLTGMQSNQILKLVLTKKQFDDLKKTKSMHFNIRFSGKDSDSKIYFTVTDKIKIRVAVFLKNKSLNY